MDETKLYKITSGTYTSNDISECLPTIFERGKCKWLNSRKELLKMDRVRIFLIK